MRLDVSRICAPGLRRSASPFTCTTPAGEKRIFAFTASSGIGRGSAAIASEEARPSTLATSTERECGRKGEPDRSGNGREQASDDPRSLRSCQCKSLINQAFRSSHRDHYGAGEAVPTRAGTAARCQLASKEAIDAHGTYPLYSRALLVM